MVPSRKIPKEIYIQMKLIYTVFPPIRSLEETCSSAADIHKHLAGLDCWIMGNAEPHHGAVVVRRNTKSSC